MSEDTIQKLEKKPCNNLAVLVLVSLLLSVASLATSVYTLVNGSVGSEKKVVISKQYDKGKSLEKALETKKPVIVFFYTDWCGFCQRFAPTYHKISKHKDIKKNFAIAYVNCEDAKNSTLMSEYGIQGFPTVYVLDGKGNKEQIGNQMLFNDDTVETVVKKAMEIAKIETK